MSDPVSRHTAGRPFWLGTSWKMTKTVVEAQAWVDDLAAAASADPPGWPDGVQLVVHPAHTALAAVRQRLAWHGLAGRVQLGAQDAHPDPDGAMTGEVSVRMVAEAGAGHVVVGHAERRTRLGESDEVVAAKTAATVAAGLVPVLCVGETSERLDRDAAGRTVADQVLSATSVVPALGGFRLVVAYEPVWAIGREEGAARPDQVAPVLAAVRHAVASERPSADLTLVYGGSVTERDAALLASEPSVDGLFVGRAGWQVSGLLRIARSAASAVGATVGAGR